MQRDNDTNEDLFVVVGVRGSERDKQFGSLKFPNDFKLFG